MPANTCRCGSPATTIHDTETHYACGTHVSGDGDEAVWTESLDCLRTRLADAQEACRVALAAIHAEGLDLAPCSVCGKVLACIPDGLPMCEECLREAME